MEKETGKQFIVTPKKLISMELALLWGLLVTAIFGTWKVSEVMARWENTERETLENRDALKAVAARLEKMQDTDMQILLAIERLRARPVEPAVSGK